MSLSSLPRSCSTPPSVRQPQVQLPKNQRVVFTEASLSRQSSASTHDVCSSEVFVSAREFKSWGGSAFRQLPRSIKEFILDIGVCHYLVLVKSPDGSVRQWDFGPCGGDVHVAIPGSKLGKAAAARLSSAMHTQPLVLGNGLDDSLEPVRGVLGEIREDLLPELPRHAPVVPIGRTTLSAEEIRDFNKRQSKYYLLHENDCRHFTNNLVQHMTGMQKGTSVFLRQQYLEKVNSSPLQHPHRPLVQMMQTMTDVSNWESLKCMTSLAAAALTTLWGASLWGGLRAAPSRIAAGLASRSLSHLVKPKAGMLMTAAAAPRPSLTLAPVAVGAASITASKVGRRHFGAQYLPSPSDDEESHSGLDLVGLDLAVRPMEDTKFGKISRVSQSVSAALAAYASAPTSQHLVHILQKQVSAVGRMRHNALTAIARRNSSSTPAEGAAGGASQSMALVTVGSPKAAKTDHAPILMARKLNEPAAHLRGPFPAAAVWGHISASVAKDTSVSQTIRSSHPPVAMPSKLPNHSRFFTRGSKALFLNHQSKGDFGLSQKQACTRDAAFTAFSAALQQQAARWYL